MALQEHATASFDSLPEDCFISIFQYSGDIQSLGRVAQTCKRLRELYLRNGIWQALLSRELGADWKNILNDSNLDTGSQSTQKSVSSNEPEMMFNFRALCKYRTIFEFEEDSQADASEFDRLYNRLQISVTGPPKAGKTWLLACLDRKDPFSDRYNCTSSLQIRTKAAIEDVKYEISLQVWEAARQTSHAWMLCYDVTSRENFLELTNMTQLNGPFSASRYKKPRVVVGCRRSHGERQVSVREGYQFAETIGADAFFEVDATNRASVKRAVLATATLAMSENTLREQGAIAPKRASDDEEDSSCLTM
eukprot:TRINITY_DN15507_c0_g1_i1.p1 TRINITY_DN15507_c0_g1~~TRINITY_DN15507_c0_g1_i1.p1  ORF type:complete len:307 (+),score=48.93 TRINITY_DN15507_c0_g1_i1:88-1008(+)